MAETVSAKKSPEEVGPLGRGPGGDASTLATTQNGLSQPTQDTKEETTSIKHREEMGEQVTDGVSEHGDNESARNKQDTAKDVIDIAEDAPRKSSEILDDKEKVKGDVEADDGVKADQKVDGVSGEQTEMEKTKKKGSIHELLERDLNQLTRTERTTLYETGIKLQSSGEMEEALACLLGAITGLTEKSTFADLPKCLHAVADIYFDKKEYEKAVYFIQAEKMYYETALIDIVSDEREADKERERSQSQKDGKDENELIPRAEVDGDDEMADQKEEEDKELSPDAKKGQEFENLARLCLKEGKLQLALDYCGKATKMYQAVYGEDHPVTAAVLDLFTVIYADVGKKIYSDAMKKFEKEEEAIAAEESHDQTTFSPDKTTGSPDTELRHRGTNNNIEKDGGTSDGAHTGITHPHAGELEPATETERDDWVITILLMLIFFLVTVFIVIVVSSVYCYNNSKSVYCAQTRGDINYWYMYARHVIHDIRKSFR